MPSQNLTGARPRVAQPVEEAESIVPPTQDSHGRPQRDSERAGGTLISSSARLRIDDVLRETAVLLQVRIVGTLVIGESDDSLLVRNTVVLPGLVAISFAAPSIAQYPEQTEPAFLHTRQCVDCSGTERL